MNDSIITQIEYNKLLELEQMKYTSNIDICNYFHDNLTSALEIFRMALDAWSKENKDE